MSAFKKWLLILIVTLAASPTSSDHGWTEALILMLLAIVVAIAVK